MFEPVWFVQHVNVDSDDVDLDDTSFHYSSHQKMQSSTTAELPHLPKASIWGCNYVFYRFRLATKTADVFMVTTTS